MFGSSRSLILLAILAVVTAGCSSSSTGIGDSQPSAGILGGTDVTASDPIAHAVARIRWTGFFCTASVIGPRTLLTGAHCVDGNFTGRGVDPATLSVEFGNVGAQDAQTRKIEKFFIHPGWLATLAKLKNPRGGGPVFPDQGDMAVVVLTEPIPEGYIPVDLLSSREMLQKGSTVTLAGFGKTALGSLGILEKVQASILDSAYGRSEIKIDQSQGVGICFQDSGGPAYVEVEGKLFLWGVASRVQNPDCTGFSVFTVVPEFADWIQSVLPAR